MKRLAALAAIGALTLGLSACGPSAEDANQTAKAFCAQHGGVKSIQYYPSEIMYVASFRAECADGSRIE